MAAGAKGVEAPVSLRDKKAEITRELGKRRRFYPGWVKAGKLSDTEAAWQIRVLEAILSDIDRGLAKREPGLPGV